MKLHPYQQAVLDKLSEGYKPGEMTIFTGGRQTGKSQLNHYIQQWMHWLPETEEPKYQIVSQAEVDGKPWYTIACRKDVSIWIRENGVENTDWFEHIDTQWNVHRNVFDICEEFYMLAVLKFGR